MTERGPRVRLPAHVLVMLGASTATYAVILAGVAGLQSRSEADLAAAREPAVRDLAALQAGHDQLAAALAAIRADQAAQVRAYGLAGSGFEAVDARLAQLAGAVAKIDGVSRSLPSSIRLPTVRAAAGSGTPATHATTGASGAP